MKYNIWGVIEVADEENDDYTDLKEEQVLLASFDSLEKAQEYLLFSMEDNKELYEKEKTDEDK